jgi:hypothetical protein
MSTTLGNKSFVRSLAKRRGRMAPIQMIHVLRRKRGCLSAWSRAELSRLHALDLVESEDTPELGAALLDIRRAECRSSRGTRTNADPLI